MKAIGDRDKRQPPDETAPGSPLKEAEPAPVAGVFTLEYEDQVEDWVAVARWINRHVRTFVWRRAAFVVLVGAVVASQLKGTLGL